jgi:ferredoxin
LQCIDCQACAGFAPDTFKRHENHGYHVVHRQPQTPTEITRAQAALRACPVAAIRLETLAERCHGAENVESIQEEWELGGHADLAAKMSDRNGNSFPHPFLKFGEAFSGASGNQESASEPFNDVYWTGHHNEASFGAIPYLVRGKYRPKKSVETTESVWVMVDSPKFSKSAVQDVTRVAPNGPDFLMMTHVDDTADHEKWAEHFPNMKQIFHEGDLGQYNWVGDKSLEQVDIVLRNEQNGAEPNNGMLDAFSLDGSKVHLSEWLLDEKADDMDLLILHTPGHSYGSISLYRRDGIVFTGDTYAATQVPYASGLQMTGFGRYGRDSSLQCATLEKMLKLPYVAIAPGHGLARDYRNDPSKREPELNLAQDGLRRFR